MYEIDTIMKGGSEILEHHGRNTHFPHEIHAVLEIV